MSISAKEIAAKLNISTATVSMVLNDKPGISEKTRELVLSTAKEYGYNFSKKNKTTHKGVIDFIIYKEHGTIVTDTPFFSQLTEGIDRGCKQAGYELLITYFYANQDVEAQIRSIAEKNCQGILFLGTEIGFKQFKPFQVLTSPIVVLDTYFEEMTHDTVLINNIQGAYLATRYLIDSGAKSVGYLHSSYKIGNFSERSDGYHKALRVSKLPLDQKHIHKIYPSMDGAYTDMLAYLKNGGSVCDAYFADNDLIAAGAIRAFKEYGYQIPEDISIIGFDGMPIGDFMEPQLTTMEVPKQRMGELAVERLVHIIRHGKSATTKLEVSPGLKVRGTVAGKSGR